MRTKKTTVRRRPAAAAAAAARATPLEALEDRRLMSITAYIGAVDPAGTTSTSGTINGTAGVPVFVNADLPQSGGPTQVTNLDDTDAAAPAKAQYQWQFLNGSNPDGSYSTLNGFSAAHIFDTPGNYTVQLTVKNQNGETATVTRAVSIAAQPTTNLYVDADNGNDTNNGTAQTSAVKTMGRLQQLLDALPTRDSNAVVQLKAGTTAVYSVTSSIFITSNVIITSYGAGAKPVVEWDATSGSQFIGNRGVENNIEVDNLDFRNGVTTATSGTDSLELFQPPTGAHNMGFRNDSFTNFNDVVNSSYSISGLLMQQDQVPGVDQLRSYFAYVGGSNIALIGNSAPNSVMQQIVRKEVSGTAYFNATQNVFSNVKLASGDSGKSTIDVHQGDYIWLAQNTFYAGHSGVGPLAQASEVGKAESVNQVVADSNLFKANPTYYGTGCTGETPGFQVQAGAQHVVIRNNVFDNTGAISGISSVEVFPQVINSSIYSGTETLTDAFEGRNALDILIANNTFTAGSSFGTSVGGEFLLVHPRASYADGTTGPSPQVQLIDNLMSAASMSVGKNPNYAAPVFAQASDLTEFTAMKDNIYPSPSIKPTNGGINYVDSYGSLDQTAGYFSPSTTPSWTSLQTTSGVYDSSNPDQFVNVTVDPTTYLPQDGSGATLTGVSLPYVPNDYNQHARPSSGVTIGAVQQSTSGTLLAFNFAGTSGTEASESPAVLATNVNGTAISRGDGLVASVQGQNTWNNDIASIPNSVAPASNTYGTSLATAETKHEYYSFTMTAASGHSLSLSQLGFEAWCQNGDSTFAAGLTYSTDGTNFTDVGSVSLAGAKSNVPQAATFDLSGIAALQNATGTVTFRIYLYGSGNYTDTAIGRSGTGGSGSNSDLYVNGTVA